MLHDAIQREQRLERADRITDINAAHHSGDRANKLLSTLRK